jgi:hypothetical protein
MENVDIVMAIASGWELEDAFTAENVEKLDQHYLGAARAVFEAWQDELTGAPGKLRDLARRLYLKEPDEAELDRNCLTADLGLDDPLLVWPENWPRGRCFARCPRSGAPARWAHRPGLRAPLQPHGSPGARRRALERPLRRLQVMEAAAMEQMADDRWSEKAKKEMLDKQMKKAKTARSREGPGAGLPRQPVRASRRRLRIPVRRLQGGGGRRVPVRGGHEDDRSARRVPRRR